VINLQECKRDLRRYTILEWLALAVVLALFTAILYATAGCAESLPPVIAPKVAPTTTSTVITPSYTYQGRTGTLFNDTGHADYVLWLSEYGKALDSAPVPAGDWVAAPDGVAGHWWASDAATAQLGELYYLRNQAMKP
jgi:hypothetical protein